jgi:membrane protease YdiL (CAAX protease family)
MVPSTREEPSIPAGPQHAELGAASPPPRVPWTYGDIGRAIVAVVALSITANFAAAVFADAQLEAGETLEDDALALTAVLVASLIAQELFLLGAALWFGPLKRGAPLATLGLRKPEEASSPWLFACALAAGALPIALGYDALLALAGVDAGGTLPEGAVHQAGPLVVVLLGSVVLAPVIEEIFFRGFIFGGIEPRLSWLPAALLSSLLFGLAHLSLLLLPAYAAIGFLFAWSYRRTGSLTPGIVAHVLTNAVSAGLLFL